LVARFPGVKGHEARAQKKIRTVVRRAVLISLLGRKESTCRKKIKIREEKVIDRIGRGTS